MSGSLLGNDCCDPEQHINLQGRDIPQMLHTHGRKVGELSLLSRWRGPASFPGLNRNAGNILAKLRPHTKQVALAAGLSQGSSPPANLSASVHSTVLLVATF